MADFASLVVPTKAGDLRIGGYMCIDSRPSKITDIMRSKTGKHGSVKCHFIAVDIFTDKKREHLAMSTVNVDVPNVVKRDFQLVNIDADDIEYLDDNGEPHTDLKMPGSDPMNSCDSDKDLRLEIQTLFDNGEELFVTAVYAMDIVCVKAFRVEKTQ
jgi:translation initiation factor 5A